MAVRALRTGHASRRREMALTHQRIADAGFTESARAQHAAVAAAARTIADRIVTAVRQTVIEAEVAAAPDDVGLCHRDERRVNAEPRAFDAGARPEIGERLERRDEL